MLLNFGWQVLLQDRWMWYFDDKSPEEYFFIDKHFVDGKLDKNLTFASFGFLSDALGIRGLKGILFILGYLFHLVFSYNYM